MKNGLMILLASAIVASGQVQNAFTNFAGMPGGPGSLDGNGSAARFNHPLGVAVDSAGNVYVADTQNNTIRKITAAGVVTTLAGSAEQNGSADGTGSAARFSAPSGVAVDSARNIYVADYFNSTIRKITSGGEVTTLAGSAGQNGSADGSGNMARFAYPVGISVDSEGNLYVADTLTSTIRKITLTGVVTTLAGSAGQEGSTDGTGIAARFLSPYGVAVDSKRNAYVADAGNYTIRKIAPDGIVTTLAGSSSQVGSADGIGRAARFNFPRGVAVDSADILFLADRNNDTIRKITPDGAVTTLAGSAGRSGRADGTNNVALFSYPSGVAVDSASNVYVADRNNDTIRKITSVGAVTTLAGSAGQLGSEDGSGSAARFALPSDVAVDSAGNIYVADAGNYTIRKLTPAGEVTTLAGTAGQRGSADGPGSSARFYGPEGIAVDGAGNVYVSDTSNQTIRKISPGGEVTTLAGTAGQNGGSDGIGAAASFNHPTGVAVDSKGTVYVADRDNSTIRKITAAKAVTTMAGTAGQVGGADGVASGAQFASLSGIAIDRAGNVYVADSGNNRISKGTPLASAVLLFVIGPSSLTISNGFFQTRLMGPLGGTALLESSANFQAWTPVQTNALPPDGLDLSVSVGADRTRFFRARLAP